MSERARLTALARASLAAVDPAISVARTLALAPIGGPVDLLALGKASIGMAQGAVEACDVRRGLVVAPHGVPSALPACVEVLRGAHPLPDDDLDARGEALLRRAASIAPGHTALVLLSGGGSALADALVPGITVSEMRALTQALMHAGASIDELNVIRASLSRLKGGGLARALGRVKAIALVVSDVPSLPPTLVASGPMSPMAPSSLDDVCARPHVARVLTPSLAARLTLQDGPAFPLVVAADNETAVAAVEREAHARGLTIARGAPLRGEARDRGVSLAEEVRHATTDAMVWGGETVVTVRGAGRGGRSHELALGALEAGMTGSLLAFGTDGVDGTSDAAGAFADDDVRRDRRGLSAREALAANDAHAFFAARGAQFVTGPTGTNVADVAIWLRGAVDTSP